MPGVHAQVVHARGLAVRAANACAGDACDACKAARACLPLPAPGTSTMRMHLHGRFQPPLCLCNAHCASPSSSYHACGAHAACRMQKHHHAGNLGRTLGANVSPSRGLLEAQAFNTQKEKYSASSHK